jgi:hypothetical protein
MQKKYVIISLVALGLSTAAFIYYRKTKRENAAINKRLDDIFSKYPNL